MKIGHAHAADRGYETIHRPYHIAKRDLFRCLRQRISPTRTLSALEEASNLQGNKDLLEKLEWDVLPLRDILNQYRLAVVMHAEV